MGKGMIGGIVTAIIIALLIICGLACTERVPAGYVGVVYNMSGGIEDNTLSQGWHIVSPTKKITLYSIGIEQSYLTATEDGDSEGDDSFEVPSKDGKGLTVDETFTYRFDADKVTKIFTRFKGRSGKEMLSIFIKPNVMAWTKEVTAKYYVTEILGEKRQALNSVLSDYLKEKFEPYGIVIETASLIDIRPDEETRKAIQKKVTAQQELELAEIERNTAKVNAEKEKEVAQINAEKEKSVAEINAEKARIDAQGKADAKMIQAEAEAKANKAIAESLSDKLLQKIKYEKWKGEVPKITGSSTPILNTDSLFGE